MSPRALFTRLAIAEAVTWALLLLGMVLKYGTHTTDLGVRVFGLAHGVVFLGYCLASLVMWVNQRWSTRTLLLALAAAIPPFATIWFEKRAVRQGLLEATGASVETAPEMRRGPSPNGCWLPRSRGPGSPWPSASSESRCLPERCSSSGHLRCPARVPDRSRPRSSPARASVERGAATLGDGAGSIRDAGGTGWSSRWRRASPSDDPDFGPPAGLGYPRPRRIRIVA